jgi:hypothetical protein
MPVRTTHTKTWPQLLLVALLDELFEKGRIFPNVRYALACRYRVMESPWIVIDKLKHIGHPLASS